MAKGIGRSFRYFNGGFLSAKGIAGKVVVRGNRIRDAFNGVRMKADRADPGQSPRLNADVHIVENDFVRIRDNPVEPEVFAYNWHVRHNRILDCHAWFSFDGVTGGFWYFYGNPAIFAAGRGPPATRRIQWAGSSSSAIGNPPATRRANGFRHSRGSYSITVGICAAR